MLQAGNVTLRDLDSGRRYQEGFDHLVLATGAVPVRPPVPGGDAGGVFGVQTLDDGAALLVGLERLRPRHAVVIGGGYIGVEMAEALTRRRIAVTVVDRAPQPMSTLDPDMGELVHQAMEEVGIDVRTDATVTGIDIDGEGRVRSVVTSDGAVPADVVVLGLGVRPNTALANQAGLPLGDHGGLRTDSQMRVLGHDRAVGRRRLCRGPQPGLRPVPAHSIGHPRQQARPSDRPQHRRLLRDIPRRGRHGDEQVVQPGDRPDRA